MTTEATTRQPSPLQRNILIVLAALDSSRPGPVATRDIERLLENGGEKPVYGNNLRASCRRMEKMGWLRMLRAKNLQLAVEITATGRQLAMPLLAAERERTEAEQRATEIKVLSVSGGESDNDTTTRGIERLVQLEKNWYLACRGDYVIRLDGTTCLQLWSATGQLSRLDGDPLQVATWLQACHTAGIDVRIQINESQTPEEGKFAGSDTTDLTDTWYRQLDAALQSLEIDGLTEEIRLSLVAPAASVEGLPAPARLLHILRDNPEAFPLTASAYAEDIGTELNRRLEYFGFTFAQATELQMHHIRWPLMSEEEFARQELDEMLNELARRRLICNRERLTAMVFSPVRNMKEPWTARLQWLLGNQTAEIFDFRSEVSRQQDRALDWLAGYVGEDIVEHLASVIEWQGNELPEKP
ncbi:hypothetical protein [Kluyvera sichuanensis]|uniref:hypothetical protein n=1 Tax=Kluyvera sichuanensis TaxID=2725494 RepID=UPI002FD0BBA4